MPTNLSHYSLRTAEILPSLKCVNLPYLVPELVETLEYLKVGAYPRGHVVKLYPDLLHVFQDVAVMKYPSNTRTHAGLEQIPSYTLFPLTLGVRVVCNTRTRSDSRAEAGNARNSYPRY